MDAHSLERKMAECMIFPAHNVPAGTDARPVTSVHSEVNPETTARVVRHTEPHLQPIELDTPCYTLFTVNH